MTCVVRNISISRTLIIGSKMILLTASSSLFNHSSNDEDASLSRDAFELLSSSIATLPGHFTTSLGARVDLVGRKLSLDPRVAGAGPSADGVAEVHGGLEVPQVLLPALGRAGPDLAAEIRAPGVAAQIGLREQQDVGLFGGGAAGELVELRQRLLAGRLGPRRCRRQSDCLSGHDFWSCLGSS